MHAHSRIVCTARGQAGKSHDAHFGSLSGSLARSLTHAPSLPPSLPLHPSLASSLSQGGNQREAEADARGQAQGSRRGVPAGYAPSLPPPFCACFCPHALESISVSAAAAPFASKFRWKVHVVCWFIPLCVCQPRAVTSVVGGRSAATPPSPPCQGV